MSSSNSMHTHPSRCFGVQHLAHPRLKPCSRPQGRQLLYYKRSMRLPSFYVLWL